MKTSQESMKDIGISLIQKRGVEINDIVEIVYDLQKSYISGLTKATCADAVDRVLGKREVQYAILTGVELDRLAEENKLSEPILSLIKKDNPLYGIDEILALSICNVYGSIGLTNFGYVDKIKPGIIGILDKKGKEEQQCHTFLDDLIGAIAAAAASSVAHNAVL
ncbi:MAG: phosphatidylglycerophosphatase A [Candidatus Izemoplasmatales bacterium]|jgi:phosphatidylglycerophosphatase A|nr:phosphatidylglycerophosphatase A [Candidatus Izemoplasmatales bacterium]MDD4595490.1 phosphatidylglycerophosphatase A [Candidatus Izemoplasmatales bacterium]